MLRDILGYGGLGGEYLVGVVDIYIFTREISDDAVIVSGRYYLSRYSVFRTTMKKATFRG